MEKQSNILHGYDCEVTDADGDPLAYVYAHYKGGIYYPYQTSVFCFHEAHGCFPIELYYKDDFIRRVNVKVSAMHQPQ